MSTPFTPYTDLLVPQILQRLEGFRRPVPLALKGDCSLLVSEHNPSLAVRLFHALTFGCFTDWKTEYSVHRCLQEIIITIVAALPMWGVLHAIGWLQESPTRHITVSLMALGLVLHGTMSVWDACTDLWGLLDETELREINALLERHPEWAPAVAAWCETQQVLRGRDLLRLRQAEHQLKDASWCITLTKTQLLERAIQAFAAEPPKKASEVPLRLDQLAAQVSLGRRQSTLKEGVLGTTLSERALRRSMPAATSLPRARM